VLNLSYFFPTRAGHVIGTALSWDSLSRSEQLLVSNVASWVKKQAWEHLTKKVREASGEPVVSSRSYKVFVSYKKKSRAEEIAETIAERLSEQGINVWFDKWEVKAGDSIPGKIEEGFKESDACIIFLSHEYGGSNWCKKEMRTALVKAIEENFTVIPSLVGVCDVPELLKDLRRVDFIKKPKATEFEQKLQEITDAIYKVDLNPYR
jgi:nucleotide-binding universal stress UspA family protein